MKLEQQVCSLDLAKKLKELGVKQDSLWWWMESVDIKQISLYFHDDIFGSDDSQKAIISMEYPAIYYSAYTSSELGEILPEKIKYKNESFWLCITKDKDKFVVQYVHKNDTYLIKYIDTLADAMGMMVEYLLKNKLMEVK